MEYAAEMLLKHLQTDHAGQFTSAGVRPRFFRGFERVPGLSSRAAWNANRLVTRFLTYPWRLRRARGEFDLFHIADHTYAQLALALPAGRIGIYCHDLDAFEPALEPRGQPPWRVSMARIQLAGLRRASLVFFSTEQIREQILRRGLLTEDRLVHAPLGVSEEFFDPRDADLPELVRGLTYVLNVAGNFPRKRLDLLFQVFARLQRDRPELRLVQHGAQLDEAQQALLRDLRISEKVVQTPSLTRPGLAALYRHARLVLLTSDREGFGFPAVEALAAGAVVVLSDIAAFREAAGDAAVLCAPGDVDAWVDVVGSLLDGSRAAPPASARTRSRTGLQLDGAHTGDRECLHAPRGFRVKVLFLNPIGTLGGAEHGLLDLIASLRKAAPELNLEVLALEDGPLVSEAAALGARTDVIPLPDVLARLGESGTDPDGNGPWLRNARAAAALALWLPRFAALLRRRRPDVLHSNGLKTHLLGALAKPRESALVWHLHDFISERRLTAQMLPRLRRRAALGVAVSEAVAQDARKLLPELRIETVLNGVRTELFAPGTVPPLDLDALADSPLRRAGYGANRARRHLCLMEGASSLPRGGAPHRVLSRSLLHRRRARLFDPREPGHRG